jgi:hypothetical protein
MTALLAGAAVACDRRLSVVYGAFNALTSRCIVGIYALIVNSIFTFDGAKQSLNSTKT